MLNVLVKFYKEVNGELIVTRTELCTNIFEADVVIEGEEGHYDKVTVTDLSESN